MDNNENNYNENVNEQNQNAGYENTNQGSNVPQGNYNGGYDNNKYSMDVLNSPTIKKFNWGAFGDTIFWGIGNKAYMSLLVLVPFLGIVWKFVAGFKGNEWAWQAGDYKSLEEFEKVQETWNRSGIARFIVSAIGIVGLILFYFLIFAAMLAAAGSSYYY